MPMVHLLLLIAIRPMVTMARTCFRASKFYNLTMMTCCLALIRAPSRSLITILVKQFLKTGRSGQILMMLLRLCLAGARLSMARVAMMLSLQILKVRAAGII